MYVYVKEGIVYEWFFPATKEDDNKLGNSTHLKWRYENK